MNRKWYIFMLVALAVVTGCRKHTVPDDVPVLPEDVPEMVISMKADAPDPKFTFLFWHKDDFDRGLLNENQEKASPYHVACPTGDIDDYQEPDATMGTGSGKENDYNTGKSYPENYGIAICTGYAPYDGVAPLTDNSGFTDYTSLEVAEPGVTDVLVGRNCLEGSAIFPFSGNLEFLHSQIQLTVRAKLAPTMAKFIKDVSFSIGSENLLSSLTWNAEYKCYRPAEGRNADQWTSAVMTNYLNSTDERVLGTVYVVPKSDEEDLLMTSIDLHLAGKISNMNTEAGTDFTMTATADLSGAEGGGLTLGDSYVILLLFDEDQIEITAAKVPWQDGGNILIPVQPLPIF